MQYAFVWMLVVIQKTEEIFNRVEGEGQAYVHRKSVLKTNKAGMHSFYGSLNVRADPESLDHFLLMGCHQQGKNTV